MESKLLAIQSDLKVPKGQWNDFGKYNYRSCEDIEKAVKPLLKKYGCEMRIWDDLVQVGNRNYVCGMVELTDGTNKWLGKAYAREDEVKKGMDGSQITGSASSYARKCALSGLFLIDDTKDSDSTDTRERAGKPAAKSSPAVKPKIYTGLIDDVSKGVAPSGKNYVCLVLDGEKCYIAKNSPEEAESDCQMFGGLMADGLKVKAEVVPAGSSYEITKIEGA